jgi:hypothetical protein
MQRQWGEGGEDHLQVIVRKTREKRALDRPRHRRADNIKPDLVEIGGVGVGWIDLA